MTKKSWYEFCYNQKKNRNKHFYHFRGWLWRVIIKRKTLKEYKKTDFHYYTNKE